MPDDTTQNNIPQEVAKEEENDTDTQITEIIEAIVAVISELEQRIIALESGRNAPM